jgi:hypothetical protein
MRLIEKKPLDSPAFLSRLFTRTAKSKYSVEELLKSAGKRAAFIASHIAANQLGLIAPRFRQEQAPLHWYAARQLGAQKYHYFSNMEAELQLYRDLLLIDLHWVICRRLQQKRHIAKTPITVHFYFYERYELTTKEDSINWPHLIGLISSEYMTSTKIKNLGLSDIEQIECKVLQSTKIHKHLMLMGSEYDGVQIKVTELTKSNTRRGKTENPNEIMHEWELLRLTEGAPTEAAKLHILQSGSLVGKKFKDIKPIVNRFDYRKRWMKQHANLKFPSIKPLPS